MLRPLMAAAALSCALAGCSAMRPPSGRAPTPTETAVGAVQAFAKSYCGTVPTGSSVEALLEAAAGAYTAQTIAAIACGGFRVVTAFTGEGARPARKRRPRKGEAITGTAIVNGRPVAVTGTVEVPATAPAR